jgi:hypothetical protein
MRSSIAFPGAAATDPRIAPEPRAPPLLLELSCPTDEDLAALISGNTRADQCSEVVQHLASCPRCQEFLALLAQVQRALHRKND